MSQPAALSRSDLAFSLLARLFLTALVLEAIGFAFFPDYLRPLSYGLVIFLLSQIVFSLYAFRYKGPQSSALILQAFGRGVFVKLLFFALALILVFRFDPSVQDRMQIETIFIAYFFMQFCQVVYSIRLAKGLNRQTHSKKD